MNDSNCQLHPDNTLTFLAELSERDRKWDSHRKKTTQVEQIYQNSEEHQDYAQRMNFCSTFLDFRLVPDEDKLKLKLSQAMFCHVRFCPVCQWRRRTVWQAKALTIVPKILVDYPSYRWLFLTLTVKDMPVTSLRDAVTHLNESFKRLTKLKDFFAEGWIKCVEVTLSETQNGYAHPHLHILLIVKPSYFGVNYSSIEKWREMWAKSARLDYFCQVDVIPLKESKKDVDNIKNLTRMICETIKYQVKETDLVSDPKWTIELTQQLKKTRSISIAGILKPYFRDLENEPEDLIGKGEEKEEETLGHVFAIWRRDCQRYVIK